MNRPKSGGYKKPVFKLNVADDNFKIQPLPAPTGLAPFRMDISHLLQERNKNKMVFHMVGDTGSAKQPLFQQSVAADLIRQFDVDHVDQTPCFLLHLGDVVYHFGEAVEYYRQFFEPYRNYPAPIFAIAGNHDGDVNPASKTPYKSLDAFVSVFCDSTPRQLELAQTTGRLSTAQPNVFYTLQTPLANIICLYSNVPKFGFVGNEQQQWFIQELKAAATQKKAIIVCIHHAPFSADANHGSSQPMINFLESAYTESGVRPHIVFSGHVHNYQRFSKRYNDGGIVRYIVAGAGGYVTLFPVVEADGTNYTNQHSLLDDVCLENYCDTNHGFLKVTIEKQSSQLKLNLEYYIVSAETGNEDKSAEPFDQHSFVIEI